MDVKFPHVKVKLAGEDGNVFSIMGRVYRAMTKAGCSQDDIDEYVVQAKSGDYDNAIRVTMATVTCDECEDDNDWRE